MLRPLLAIVLSGSWLVACAAGNASPDRRGLRPAPVKVIVGGGFCPPGHAESRVGAEPSCERGVAPAGAAEPMLD